MTGPSDPQDPYGGQPYLPPPPYGSYPSAYPPAGYQAGYQPGHQPGYQPGYQAPPGYPLPYAPYQYPPPPVGSSTMRPTTVAGAAVLSFVAAGLLVFAGIVLVAAASTADVVYDAFDRHSSISTELTLDGLGNLLAAMLLIAGGVMVLGGNQKGRPLVLAGTVITVAFSIYWIVRPDNISATLFAAVIFAALGIIATALLMSASARTYLVDKPAPKSPQHFG